MWELIAKNATPFLRSRVGMAAPVPLHSFSQTKAELTLTVPLPPGRVARDITCRVANGRVDVRSKTDVLVSGELWGEASSSVWSVESGLLTLEIEKAKPKFWPCALRGDQEVDVAALVAKEKREAEPAYKPPPDADMTPRRVTDKETIRKLKAEFPQLELPVDTQEHKATHANYAGHRSAFSWGSVEAAAAAAEAVRAPPSAAAVALPSAPPVLPKSKVAAVAAALSSTTSEPAAASDAGKYSWGALPAEPSQRASGRQELTQSLSTSPLPQPLSTSPLPQALSTSSLPPPPPQALSTSALPQDPKPEQQLPVELPAAASSREEDVAAGKQMYCWGALPSG